MADSALEILVGLKNQTKAGFDQLHNDLNKAHGGFNLLKIGALAAAAAVGTMIGVATKLAVDFANTGEELQNMSARTGIAVKQLSALKMVSEESGIAMGSIEMAVKKTQLAIASEDDSLKSLGLNFKILKSLKPEEQFVTVANAIKDLPTQTEKVAAATAAWGKSGTELLPLLQGQKFSMEELVAEAEKMGVAWDDLALDRAQGLDMALDKLKTGFEGIKMSIAVAAAPYVESFANLINDHLPEIRAFAEQGLKLIGDTFQWIGDTIIPPLQEAFNFLVAQWNIHKETIMTIWNSIMEVIGTAGKLIVDIMQVQVKFVIDLLSKVWQDHGTQIQSVVTRVIETVQKIITTVADVFGRVKIFLDEHPKIWEIFSGAVSDTIGIILTIIESVASKVGWLMDRVRDAIKLAEKLGIISASALGSAKGAGAAAKFAHGGIVGYQHGGMVDSVPALLSPGELVLNAAQQHSLASRLGGVTIDLRGANFFGDDKRFATKVGDLIADKLKQQLHFAR